MSEEPIEMRFIEPVEGEDYREVDDILLHSWKPENGKKGFELVDADTVTIGQLETWKADQEHRVVKVSEMDVARALAVLLQDDHGGGVLGDALEQVFNR